MDVLGHHDVANKEKPIACPRLVKNFKEGIPLSWRIQQRPPPVATAGDEMQMALPIASFEAILHGQVKTRTLAPARVRHPQNQH